MSSNKNPLLYQKVRNLLESSLDSFQIEIEHPIQTQIVNRVMNGSIIQIIEQINVWFQNEKNKIQSVEEVLDLQQSWNVEVIGSMRTLFVQEVFFFKLNIEISDNIKQFIFELSKSPAIPSQDQLKHIYDSIPIDQQNINQINKLIFDLRTKYQENKNCLELVFLSFLNEYHREYLDKEIFQAIKEVVISGFYNQNVSEIEGYFKVMKFSDAERIQIKTKWAFLLKENINSKNNPQIPSQIEMNHNIKLDHTSSSQSMQSIEEEINPISDSQSQRGRESIEFISQSSQCIGDITKIQEEFILFEEDTNQNDKSLILIATEQEKKNLQMGNFLEQQPISEGGRGQDNKNPISSNFDDIAYDKKYHTDLQRRFFETLYEIQESSSHQQAEIEYSNISIYETILETVKNELNNPKQKMRNNIKESELNCSLAKQVMKDPINLFNIMKGSKSYLFDILKRRRRFDSYLSELQLNLISLENDTLNQITQLEFIILFINSVNEQQQSQIGNWISLCSYPIPLFVRDKEFEYKAMFKLQTQCYQNYHPVVVNFGTPSTKGTGKTKSILSILGENKNNLNFYMNDDKVGLIHDNSILAYYHLYKSIQLMDINYETINSMLDLNQDFLKGVLTTICFSSIKIIHVNLKHDFDETGSPKKELQQILDLCINSLLNEKYKRFIIIYRDFSSPEKQLQNIVSLKLLRILGTSLYGEITIPNLIKFQDSSFDSQISKISSEFLPILDRLILEEQVPSYDLELIQQFYDMHSLMYYENNYEKQLKDKYLFYNVENNLLIKSEFSSQKDFEKLFPFQLIDKEIKDKENELRLKQQQTNRFISEFTDNRIEKEKTELKEKITILEKRKQQLTLSAPVKTVLEILKQNMDNIQVVESALTEWKIPIISPIRRKYGNLLQEFQQAKFGQVEIQLNDINGEIKKLDDQINNYDMSFETISQEVVSSFETSKQINPNIQNFFKQIAEQQLLHSKPVNIIDGKTLQFGNIILEQAIESLDQNKKVYVISIIGAQSSAKSTLLNYLFGCGFQTSEGRCTKGMYISIFNYENFYILLLDTEGLLSVQARDRTFDNQVCTLAFALSNIVLFNNKGELTTVQKDLLEVCMYALRIVCQAKSKPKIIFCQRDQQSYDLATQQQILTNLLGNLNEAGKKVGIQVKDVVDITEEDLFLLAPAFISTTGMNENQVSYPNKLFSQQVMKLRHYIILLFFIKNQGVSYSNIKEFYNEGKQNWTLILEKGQSILELKSILEQKIKLDLETVANEYVKKNYQELQKQLNNIYENNKKEKSFNKIEEIFMIVLNGFIDRGKSEFYLQVESQKYGDNKSWKDMAMNEIISSYKYYKEQDATYFKKQHQKYQSQNQLESLQEEIQEEVNILIKNNQTNEEDFNKLFDQLTQTKLNKIKKLLELSQSKEAKQKILQKIYHCQKDLNHLNNKTVEQRIFGVGLDDLFSFVMDQGEKIIEQIKSQNDKINIDLKNIFDDILKINNSFFSSEQENKKKILFNILQQYIFEIENSLQKENNQDSKIRDMESIINNTVSLSQNKVQTISQNLKYFLEKIGLYLIFRSLLNLEREEIKQFERQAKDLIKKQKQICQEVFNGALDNSQKGKKAAKLASEKLIESFENRQQAKIELDVKERINDQFPTPKSLNEQAYQISFKKKNFPNVIKYINNITKLIIELCDPIKQKQRDWIDLQRLKFLNELKDVFQEVLNNSTNWKDSNKENQSLISFSQIFKSEKLLRYSTNLYIEIYDQIAIKKEFIEGFIKQFGDELTNLPKVCEDLVKKLIQFSDKEVVQKSINAQGCEDRCPYCHNKCSEISGHSGNHKVVQHLSQGFRGFRFENTLKVCLERCVDSEMYKKKYKNYEQQVEYISLDNHIDQYHQKWRESIPRKGEGNNDTEETREDIIIAWEGTKNYFLEKYRISDDFREDWNYIFGQSGKERLIGPFDDYD